SAGRDLRTRAPTYRWRWILPAAISNCWTAISLVGLRHSTVAINPPISNWNANFMVGFFTPVASQSGVRPTDENADEKRSGPRRRLNWQPRGNRSRQYPARAPVLRSQEKFAQSQLGH